MLENEKYQIKQMSQGDREAFECLYRCYVDRIYGFVYDLLKSSSLTQDIVQEVFIAVWEHRLKIDPELSFKSYLFTIAHRRVLNEFRRQVNQPHFSDYMEYLDAALSSEEPIFRGIDFDAFCRQLAKAKAKLTQRQLHIFELHIEKGFTVTEIAAHLSINPQSVRNSLTVSRTVLKRELESFKPLLVLLFTAGHFSI